MFISVYDLFNPWRVVFCLLQPVVYVDYHGLVLTETKRKITQAGYRLQGLCYSDETLYVGERLPGTPIYILAAYRVQSDIGDIMLMDRLELERLSPGIPPRVDCQSRRVFVPCRNIGVAVARLDGDRLVRERTLTCVREALSVDAMSPDTVYVCDRICNNVRVVDVRDDRVTSTLKAADTVKGEKPLSLAVLGDSVMVSYGGYVPTLVVYRHDSPVPAKVISRPVGLERVYGISTDRQSNFLVTDWKTDCVFVIAANGDLHYTLKIDTDSQARDSAVVNGQLWVGSHDGDIVVMSSQ